MHSKPDRVWYVAYGSNVNEQRFLRYLTGDDNHVGARDATPPTQGLWTTAPLQLRFAGESRRWGGGVCFVDPYADSTAYVRAWDVTAEQFEDVFAQENRRTIGEPFDWEAVQVGPAVIGDSWYAQVLPLDVPGVGEGELALTFTWTTRFPLNAPAPAYRDTIEQALIEHPELSADTMVTYLDQAAL